MHAIVHRRGPTLALLLLTSVTATAVTDVVTRPHRQFGLGELALAVRSPDGQHLATAGISGAFLWDYPTGRLRHRLETHGSAVTAASFSPDSRTLVTGGHDGSIRTWTVASGEPVLELERHQITVSALRFSADGTAIVSASADHTARIFSADAGKPLLTVEVPGMSISDALLTRDGRWLVTSDSAMTNNVTVWDATTGTPARTLGEHIGAVYALAELPDGSIATAGDDRRVRRWNPGSGERIQSLEGATQVVGDLTVGLNGTTLMAGCQDGRILTWDLTSGAVVDQFLAGAAVLSLSPGVESDQLLVALTDNRVVLLDPSSGSVHRAFAGHTTSTTTGVAFSPDGRFVLGGGTEKSTRVWNRTNAEPVRTFEGHGAGTSAVAVSPDGTRVLTTIGFPAKAAQLWNAATGALERELPGHTDWVMAAVFSRAGDQVATASLDRTVKLWDAASGALRRTFTGHQSSVHSVALSPDGRQIAGGGSSFEPVARLWNAESGELLHAFEANAGTVKALAFAPSGDRLAVGWEDGILRLYDPATGALIVEWQAGGAFLNAVAFSPDPAGDYLLTGEGWPFFTARLWSARTGEMLRVLAGHTAPVNAVAFSADGRYVLTGADHLRLWDVGDVLSRLVTTSVSQGLELRWSLGELQHTPGIGGDWSAVPDAHSPWTVGAAEPAGFYRVALPNAE